MSLIASELTHSVTMRRQHSRMPHSIAWDVRLSKAYINSTIFRTLVTEVLELFNHGFLELHSINVSIYLTAINGVNVPAD